MWQPQRVTLSTCAGGGSERNGTGNNGANGDFSPVIRVYDEWPGHAYGDYAANTSSPSFNASRDVPRPLRPVSYRQNPRNRSCATLVVELRVGSYWVMVGSVSAFVSKSK